MAIYSCSISNVSRGKGSNSCATLSYITGSKVYCERVGLTFSYGRKERVIYTETLLPAGAPEEYKNGAELFNAIENYERNSNARTAKKIMVALPREFKLDRQIEVVKKFCHFLTKQGYACTFAIHYDKEGNNPHAHILVANRPMNDKGEFMARRKKEFVFDEDGNKVPVIDKKTGLQKIYNGRKQWKRREVERHSLDSKDTFNALRERWANVCNEYLDENHQITEKSHAERGLDIKPTIHEGYAAREIEKRGGWSELCEYNRAVRVFNNALKRLNLEILLNKNKRDQLINDTRPATPTPAQLLRRSKQRQHNEWRGFMLSRQRAGKQQVNTPVTPQPHQQTAVKREPVNAWQRGWQSFNEINRHFVPQQQTPVQPPTPAPPPPAEPPKKRPQQQQATGLRARAQQAQRASESQEKTRNTGTIQHEER